MSCPSASSSAGWPANRCNGDAFRMSKDDRIENKTAVETAHKNVESIHGNVEIFRSKRAPAIAPSYPPELKEFTFQILVAYKEKLGASLGKKTLGWQAVHRIVVEKVSERRGDRVAEILTRHTFEDWDRRRTVPPDHKFRFIDEFIKIMEVAGEFEEIRREINRLKHRHRRTYFDRIISSPCNFSERYPEKYREIVSELEDTFWISKEISINYYKQFLFHIGGIDGSTFDVAAVYFPYALDTNRKISDFHEVFVSAGMMRIDTLKGNRPDASEQVHAPYIFGDSFSVILFRDENREGEDGALTNAELQLLRDKIIVIRWGFPIVAPSIKDYYRHSGVLGEKGVTPSSPMVDFDNPEVLLNPWSDPPKDDNLYVGSLRMIQDRDKIEEIRKIFDKFEY